MIDEDRPGNALDVAKVVGLGFVVYGVDGLSRLSRTIKNASGRPRHSFRRELGT